LLFRFGLPHDEGMPSDRASLLALRDLIAHGEGPSHGQPRSREDLHEPSGKAKFDHPNADAEIDQIDERFFEKVENLWAAYCLHFAYYNFCRIHKLCG
jgi:hypothetical protein